MTLRKICEIKNNQLTLNLPDSFKGKKKVLVIVDDAVDGNAKKLALLKKAAADPLFVADVKEVNNDFGSVDHETL